MNIYGYLSWSLRAGSRMRFDHVSRMKLTGLNQLWVADLT